MSLYKRLHKICPSETQDNEKNGFLTVGDATEKDKFLWNFRAVCLNSPYLEDVTTNYTYYVQTRVGLSENNGHKCG